ncbi:MAG: TetR/AcrR family transcriptional regulator [Lautropia sp.]
MNDDSTRQRLILAAERAFAEQGIDGVSLREINRAAGQRNASALHYHFGTRDALLRAIFEHRMAGINRRRLQLLGESERSGRATDLRALVEVIVAPLAEQLGADGGASHYVRFLAQVHGHPEMEPSAVNGGEHESGLRRARRLIRLALGGLPDEIVKERMRAMTGQILQGLADLERMLASRSRAADVALRVSNLVDVVAAGLSAPVSPTTAAQLKQHRRRSA